VADDLSLDQGLWRNAFAYHPAGVNIDRAEGPFIYDEAGERYYDVSCGPFAVHLGHAHPRINAAIKAQLDRYAFAHPTLGNPKRAELCDAIASVSPKGLNASYLVSGGSEAVETAMKIARQYHVATGRPGKYKIISNYESYHGMTLATMGLSGSPGNNRRYDPMVPHWPKTAQYSDHRRPPRLTRDEWAVITAQELERIIHYESSDTVAAFIATPHGCGSEYGVVPPKRYWEEIRRICDENEVLLIADEVVSGFCRTGKWFAMEHFDVTPDIMTIAKGVSSSYVPLGAAVVSDKVNEPFARGVTFVHGFTNGGHPLACAAGIAAIQVMKDDEMNERVEKLGAQIFKHADRLRAHPSVKDVRGWGMFMVMELGRPDVEDRTWFPGELSAERRFQETGLANGLVFYSALYGARRTPLMSRGLPMWISPPFVIEPDQIEDMMDRVDRTLHQWEQSLMGDLEAKS
jgi:putrescine aminotransferase